MSLHRRACIDITCRMAGGFPTCTDRLTIGTISLVGEATGGRALTQQLNISAAKSGENVPRVAACTRPFYACHI